MTKAMYFNGISFDEMKEFLDEKYLKFNNKSFIQSDPISIPHKYSEALDIEISAFLTATIAWGSREQILKSANELLSRMGWSPHSFVTNVNDSDIERFSDFYYRTFNGIDCIFFIKSLKNIYTKYGSIENILYSEYQKTNSMIEALARFRTEFFSISHQHRSEKHFANVTKGAAGKRLNMFLRWMVRKDKHGVDFGIWDQLPASKLYIPLDLHSGNIARRLGLLKRKSNDWVAVEELTNVLKLFDAYDPVKYDFALFGLGVNHEL